MNKREISVGLCGVVLGVLLGTGAVYMNGGATGSVSETGVDIDRCPVQVEIAQELREIVLPLIPARPVDIIVRSTVTKAFDAYTAECMQYIVTEEPEPDPIIEEVEEVQPVKRDYSHCEKFSGVRRSRCVVEMRRNGIKYRSEEA